MECHILLQPRCSGNRADAVPSDVIRWLQRQLVNEMEEDRLVPASEWNWRGYNRYSYMLLYNSTCHVESCQCQVEHQASFVLPPSEWIVIDHNKNRQPSMWPHLLLSQWHQSDTVDLCFTMQWVCQKPATSLYIGGQSRIYIEAKEAVLGGPRTQGAPKFIF